MERAAVVVVGSTLAGAAAAVVGAVSGQRSREAGSLIPQQLPLSFAHCAQA